MADDEGNSDTALSNEVVRALGNEVRRLREDHAVVDQRNTELEEKNARLKRKLQRALQAKEGGGEEEEPCILIAGNHYEQVKQALKESEQQREEEEVEHARVVEELRNKLARGKEKRAALRSALSETREFDVKALLRWDELDILDLSGLHGFTKTALDAWVKIGMALDEPRYRESIWKCGYEDSLWAASKESCVLFHPSHFYNADAGSFKHLSPEYIPRPGATRDIFHREGGGQKVFYCGGFKCEWSCSILLQDLDSFTRVAPDTITQIKETVVAKACAGGGAASRTAAHKMLEDGSMTVGCYGLVKTDYRYQVDLAMEAYTRECAKSKYQTRKRPADDASTGHKKSKKKRKPSSS
ncbi:hypothetical protein C8Q72DRAFT_854611 [Fomitopsis betulina]|nr:hypothetical protein C8Q72DRAFT_854611 [Fomitopsis betulina]